MNQSTSSKRKDTYQINLEANENDSADKEDRGNNDEI